MAKQKKKTKATAATNAARKQSMATAEAFIAETLGGEALAASRPKTEEATTKPAYP